MTNIEFLSPVLILIGWTMIIVLWMYATRVPAMTAAKIHPNEARHPGTYGDRLPANVRAVADNHNHLHEQPTLFYALMIFSALTGGASSMLLSLAYAYTGLRVVHSFVQILSPNVMPRFILFVIGSVILLAMTVSELIRVFL
ncbi:MAG: Uncharacterised protein [Hyphomonas sp. TMED17]|nr:MAG: Uncharacterised protein [Hyphomonas sp. TMED17]